MYPEELNYPADPERPAVEQVTLAVTHAASQELTDALGMVEHCLGQLSDEQIWRRDTQELNSIGSLVLHLAGNLRQWVVAGLGGAPDVRDRPREFAHDMPIPGRQLLVQLQDCVAEASAALQRLGPDDLLRTRRIQGFEMTGMAALWHTVPHFRGHTQEIIRATRQQLGSAYRVAWSPRSREQGAPADD